MNQLIKITRLQVETYIGVPDEERSSPQKLCISMQMQAKAEFKDLKDEIGQGVDYYQVSLRIKEVAAQRPRKLIETLAEDIADMVLAEFDVKWLSVEIEKYILTDADSVGVFLIKKL